MITKQSIENLKNHVEIVDVISQFLELKKAGANFKACCPFHGEKTPSFVVSPAKQIYHCFGCGASGDSIKFLMEYEKLNYPEALEKLASMYNVTLSYDNSSDNKSTLDLKVLDSINDFYQKLFINNESVKEYIKNRGVSQFSMEKFGIGYAPKSFDTINYLKNNFFNLADAKELGLVGSGENGLYSKFIERITFPIYNLSGKIVGFGGRTITDHNAKYVNSPQTKIFNKSKLLYGYNLAKSNIYKKNEIIVTEGYLDVIMLHQAGFNTAVATLGTALTKQHLPILKRGEPKVIIAYDGDKAGLNAAFKASVMLSQSEFEGGVTIFEEGIDPADMVKNKEIKKLDKMFSVLIPFIKYVIDYIIEKYDISAPVQKQKALKEVNDYMKSLNILYQDEYKRYIAQKLNIRESLVKLSVQNRNKVENNLLKVDIAELGIIKAILEKPSRLDYTLDIIDLSMFEYHKKEFEMVINDISNPHLNNILLNEKLENYDDNRLKEEIYLLLSKFYINKLDTISQDKSMGFREKTNKIRKLKDKIFQLKQGKMVIYN